MHKAFRCSPAESANAIGIFGHGDRDTGLFAQGFGFVSDFDQLFHG